MKKYPLFISIIVPKNELIFSPFFPLPMDTMLSSLVTVLPYKGELCLNCMKNLMEKLY